jgi:pyruvate dehydrogenase E1 component alpha subunit/2-oxoisovalerate dehydrogenase E1 component alpha subunit
LSSLTSEELRELFRYLVLSRGLEERLEHLLKQGQVVGDLYDGRGQEAAVVGSAFALEEGDWLAPSLREMGALLTRGLDPRLLLLQYLARDGSPSAGRDRAHHLTIPHLGLLGPIGPLGAHLCVLNGVALAFRMRGERRVCLTYLGDGASRTGAAHEGLNLAAVQRLPLVVILIHAVTSRPRSPIGSTSPPPTASLRRPSTAMTSCRYTTRPDGRSTGRGAAKA